MAWRIGRILLVLSVVALGSGVLFLALPVSNPGVQDCGAPAAYAMTGRGNTRLLRPSDVDAVEEFEALRAQASCSERVEQRMQFGTWSVGAFIVLAAVGATLGLVDDRLRLRRAPRFEQLLRERPNDAPGEIWDEPVVPREDIGRKLPDIESSDVEALAVWSVATVCVLLIVSGVGETVDVLDSASIILVIGAVVLAVGSRVVAGAQLLLVESVLLERGGRLDRSVRLMVACDFAGRLRPAFGAIGVQSHALVRRGISRDSALTEMGVMNLLAALVHITLTAGLFVLTVIVGVSGSWPPYQLVLVLPVVALVVAGLTVLSARLHRLPCTLDRQTFDRLRDRWQGAPSEVGLAALLAAALPLLHGLVLTVATAAFGDVVPMVPIFFVVMVGLTVGVVSPTPEGLMAADATMVIGLSLSGVDAVTAVAAVLMWRVAMTWLPMLPGFFVSRRLTAQGTL